MFNFNKRITLIFVSIIFSTFYYFILPVSIFNSLPMGDTPIFEYFGYAMTKGELPYKDLFDHKGIFIFLAHYVGYALMKETGIKLVFSIFIFVFIYFSLKIIKLFTNNSLAILFSTSIIFLNYIYISELGLNVETLALPFITMSLYIYLNYFLNDQLSKINIILLGISFFIVFFTRANMISIWVFFTIIIFIIYLKNKNYKLLLNYILYFFIGMCIVLIPTTIYLIKNNILYDMLYQAFYVNFTYAGGSGAGVFNLSIWLLKLFKEMNIILIVAVANILLKIDRKLIAYNLLFIFATYMAFLSKRDYYHYIIVLIPLLIPYVATVFNYIFTKIKMNIKNFILIAITTVVLYLSGVEHFTRSLLGRDNIDNTFAQASEYIKNNTNSETKIYVHRLSGTMYLQAERMASTKYFFIPSINEEIYFDNFKEEIEESNPEYIVISNYFINNEKCDKFIQEYVDKNYSEEFKVEHLLVYKKTKY